MIDKVKLVVAVLLVAAGAVGDLALAGDTLDALEDRLDGFDGNLDTYAGVGAELNADPAVQAAGGVVTGAVDPQAR